MVTAKGKSTFRSLKLNPYLLPYPEIRSYWIQYLNMNPKTLTPFQNKTKQKTKNTGSTLQDIGVEKVFLSKTPFT